MGDGKSTSISRLNTHTHMQELAGVIARCRRYCLPGDFKRGQMLQLKCPLTVRSTQAHSPTVEGNLAPKTQGESLGVLTNRSVSEHQKLIH